MNAHNFSKSIYNTTYITPNSRLVIFQWGGVNQESNSSKSLCYIQHCVKNCEVFKNMNNCSSSEMMALSITPLTSVVHQLMLSPHVTTQTQDSHKSRCTLSGNINCAYILIKLMQHTSDGDKFPWCLCSRRTIFF